jgi:vacuolar protein sorting-associated protein 45
VPAWPRASTYTSLTQALVKKEYDANPKEFEQPGNTTLIITERKEDPATPLVFDWSYLSMLNDIIHVEDNKVTLKGDGTTPKSYNLFAQEDEFLRNNMYSNYGEVASNIEDFLKRITDKKKNTQNIQNFEDMRKVLDTMPEMRKESGNLNKHYELIDEIIKKVKTRRLLEIGEIEQTLVAKESKNDSFKAINEIIDDEKFSSFDIFRLCVLYNIKYEGDSKANQLFQKLKERLGPQVL